MRYKCPSCGFPLFNRRVSKCERCNEAIPQELLYSAEQVESIDAEFAKNRAQIDRLKRNMGVTGGSSGDSGGGDWGGGDCGGD